MTWLTRFEENLRSDFAEMIADGRLPETQIKAMVEFEAGGFAAAEHVGNDWCRCGETAEGTETYYRKANGYHGWFHDPRKGGCGGITQSG